MIASGHAAAVLVRVHDRMDDLEVCLRVIRRHWKRGGYHVVVVSNGLSKGIAVPDTAREFADEVVELEENAGHLMGSRQLLEAGMLRVPEHCRWTVLLEADTWIFDDAILRRYMERLEREERVWASALWVERYYSLAVDAAVVDTSFAHRHPEIFAIEVPPGPEAWVHESLERLGHEPLYIREHMPVHPARVARRFSAAAPLGRFRTFVRAGMVTHHVEDLPGGIEEKKRIANRVLGRPEFDVPWDDDWARYRRRMLRAERLRAWVPRSTWFRSRRWAGGRSSES